MSELYENLMKEAISEARKALAQDEVPVGALIVTPEGEIISRAHNSSISLNDPTAHAEVLAIRDAGRTFGNYRLTGMILVSTIEPCIMCAGAMIHARISRCVFGAYDRKGGGLVSLYSIASDRRLNHRIEIIPGVLERECRELIRDFFKKRRRQSK